jgi:predicted short-subunit dehydrogenase-like oxidoreductase (DUF2520 family)
MNGEAVRRIACIGSGNVASSLLPALYGAGYKIAQVCSRNSQTAHTLAKAVGAACTSKLVDLDVNVDLYIISVSDDEIENVLSSATFGNSGIVLHMSGSTPMSVFEKYGIARYGVLYPLQTFARQHSMNFAQVPLYVEAKNQQDLSELAFLARKLSVNVFNADSETRMMLHIAAVFACNFSNQMLAIAAQLLQEAGLDYASIKPLMQETFERALRVNDPIVAQTGPAVRGDKKIIANHLNALSKRPQLQRIYQLVSDSIEQSSAAAGQKTKTPLAHEL